MLFVLSLVPALKQHFNELINRKSQRNGDKKLNLLFLQRPIISTTTINTEEFDSNLLKIDKTYYKGIDIYYIGHNVDGDCDI